MKIFLVMLIAIFCFTCNSATLFQHRRPADDDGQITIRLGSKISLRKADTSAPELFSEGSLINGQYIWVYSEGQIKTSSNNGKSWFSLSLVDKKSEIMFGRIQDTNIKPYFVSESRGWLYASGFVWQTNDSGLTWKAIFEGTLTSVTFFDSRKGFLAIDERERPAIYITHDKGDSWHSCADSGIAKGAYVASASFITPTSGIGLLSRYDKETGKYLDGLSKFSSNGCSWIKTWESSVTLDQRFSEVFFVDENTGWLAPKISQGYLRQTMNGGRSWQEKHIHNDLLPISVYFSDVKTGWVLCQDDTKADRGYIYTTIDGGESWQEISNDALIASGNLPTQWKRGQLFRLLLIARSG